MNQLIFKFPFKTTYFEKDFFVSTNNFEAYKLIESWPKWHDKKINIFGPSGCGKTHLVNILSKKLKLMSVSADKFDDKINKFADNFDCIVIENYDENIIKDLSDKFDFRINDHIITAELSENILQDLLSQLLEVIPPISLSFEDLPVEETMKSCNNNYLFKSGEGNDLDGYAILGETRKFTYLQRIGIVKDYQGSGLGDNLLRSVVDFALKRKFLNIKLNTQNDNVSALSLYKKNNFQIMPRKLVIMKTS